jgi:hypothetical protein
MKTKILALAAAALAVSGALSVPAFAGDGHASHKLTTAEKGEAKLAKLLEGRTAGKPVNCITTLNSSDLQVIDETALVYKTGKTVYVARPSHPKQLRRDDILVTKRTGSQLCTNDSIRTVDRSGGFSTGAVFLDHFVPYTKG